MIPGSRHRPAAVTAAVVHQHNGMFLRQSSLSPFADSIGELRVARALAGPVPGVHRPDGHRQARVAADLPRSLDDTTGWAEETGHLTGGLVISRPVRAISLVNVAACQPFDEGACDATRCGCL